MPIDYVDEVVEDAAKLSNYRKRSMYFDCTPGMLVHGVQYGPFRADSPDGVCTYMEFIEPARIPPKCEHIVLVVKTVTHENGEMWILEQKELFCAGDHSIHSTAAHINVPNVDRLYSVNWTLTDVEGEPFHPHYTHG